MTCGEGCGVGDLGMYEVVVVVKRGFVVVVNGEAGCWDVCGSLGRDINIFLMKIRKFF